jgi:hypothetical protein
MLLARNSKKDKMANYGVKIIEWKLSLFSIVHG